MVKRFDENPLITPVDVFPSRDDYQVVGAFNPGATLFKDQTLLLLRVAECPQNKTPDEQIAPILNPQTGQIEHFRMKNDDPRITDIPDSRSFYVDGQMFLTSISHLRLARSDDGIHFTVDSTPTMFPSLWSETFGLEDPRITRIDQTYYITYKSVSDKGICTSLASTTDFRTFERHGVVFCPENIDVVLFPEKIAGKYWALTRPVPRYIGPRGIWIASSPDLMHWGDHRPLLLPEPDSFHDGKTGGSCVPIRTDEGWLVIYHGSDQEDRYTLAAALLDLQDPSRVLARPREALMQPEADYEIRGFYGNVIFSCGAVTNDTGWVTIYYGAADQYTAGARVSIDDICKTMEPVQCKK
ncbi:MAG: glycoside hydrolase family 130 protein [Sedimentisphaerales bacterium]|nr:glycoside hydrolase family 130 protein [Sedimentisphaerales bacterium]